MLFSTGQNIPEALLKLALGMDVDTYTHYDVGRMFIRYSYDLIGDISSILSLGSIP